MSESMSSPWIRDYFMEVAETYGAQLYSAPVSSGKKKVQLTDYLTCQENSYVWAWISDKDYRVSVRISKDAVDLYRSKHSRNIIDCRFSVVFISSYRPMFSPRPLGPGATGNTAVSHISLEIGYVSSVGIGGHLFGDPHDLESDDKMKEWVLGLRQDGGGGNVLKLRKQEELARNASTPSSLPPPPPLSLHAPISQCQATKATEEAAKPKSEQPQDFKRAYAKRWRIIEANPWKFATKPAAEELSNPCPSPPRRTPSPTSGSRVQGTPTEWSPSNRGSSVSPHEVTTAPPGNEIRRHDDLEALPTALHPPSDTEEHATITCDTRSPPPPTPAQRIQYSPPLRTTSSPRSSPDVFAHSSPLPFQPLPCSSPPPPSSSLSLPLSSLPVPANIRKNIQRKVPHPGHLVARPDPIKQGPVRILVPNSDPSGTGSSQSYSQSQRQILSPSPAFPSSLVKDFKPPDASTPKRGRSGSLARHTPKMFAESLPTHCDASEQETASVNDKYSIEKAETSTEKQVSDSTRPPAPSAPKIEVLEVATSDTEEEIDQLQLIQSTAQEVGLATQTGARDIGEGDVDAKYEDDHSSVDKVEANAGSHSSPPRRPSCPTTVSVIEYPSQSEQVADGVSVHHISRSSERAGSQSSMHSFSVSLEGERTKPSRVSILPASQTEDKILDKGSLGLVPRHDSEAWKEPSFLARNKGKSKACTAKELDTASLKMSKKRVRSTLSESPVPKRAKVTPSKVCREGMHPRDVEAPTIGKIHSSRRSSTTPTDMTETMARSTALQLSRPRLANLVVEFEKIDLGKKLPVPMVDMDRDMKCILLRTGRIRTLGKEVESDGSVYIMR